MKPLHIHVTASHNWVVIPDGCKTPMVSNRDRSTVVKFAERYHLKTGCDVFVHDEGGLVQEHWHVNSSTAAAWKQKG